MIFVRAPKNASKVVCIFAKMLHENHGGAKNVGILKGAPFPVGRFHPMNLQVGLGGVYTAAFGECGLDLRRASSLGSGSRVGGEWRNWRMDIWVFPKIMVSPNHPF